MIQFTLSIVVPFVGSGKTVEKFLNHWADIIALPQIEELILVNNNDGSSHIEVPHIQKVRIVKCEKKGPASARNFGVKHVLSDWVWFTDIDCRPGDIDLSIMFSEIQKRNAVAVQGYIHIDGHGWIVEHYRKHQAFCPKHEKDIITACFLIKVSMFSKLNGFNESFPLAGGEDTDFGERMSSEDEIIHSSYVSVYHITQNSLASYCLRYYRYGVGTGILLKKHNQFRLLPSNPGISLEFSIEDNFLFGLRWIALTIGRIKVAITKGSFIS